MTGAFLGLAPDRPGGRRPGRRRPSSPTSSARVAARRAVRDEREGGLRRPRRRRRDRRRDRRGARASARSRTRRALGRDRRRGHRRQPEGGRRLPGRQAGPRLLRRPGDEGDPRPGQRGARPGRPSGRGSTRRTGRMIVNVVLWVGGHRPHRPRLPPGEGPVGALPGAQGAGRERGPLQRLARRRPRRRADRRVGGDGDPPPPGADRARAIARRGLRPRLPRLPDQVAGGRRDLSAPRPRSREFGPVRSHRARVRQD